MYRKYQLWFEFAESEEEAKRLCALRDSQATPYMRRKHPAHYTPWNNREQPGLFVVWSHA